MGNKMETAVRKKRGGDNGKRKPIVDDMGIDIKLWMPRTGLLP